MFISTKFEPEKESKALSISTYAQEEQILKIFESKQTQILGFAYIFHDKDVSEPHRHVVVVLKRSRKQQEVLNWFKKCTDDKGERCNTRLQPIACMRGLEEYLTHSDDDSIKAGKHQYNEQDIKVLKDDELFDYVTDYDKAQEREKVKEEKADEVESLIDDIISGVPLREMARRYGRDYMKNATAYRRYASDVVLEETGDLGKALQICRYDNRVLDQVANEAVAHTLDCVKMHIQNAYKAKVEPTCDDLLEFMGMK